MKDIVIQGDVYAGLEQIANNSIAIAITSPPYWKQRDYGFEGQIGQEKTPEEYIGKLITVFNKLKEKLRDDGVFFLNIGDKYLQKYGKSHLLQIPYRLAYHMIKNGWILEDILIWYKPNHMPSPVKDRFSNTYEPILVFTKSKNSIYKKKPEKILKISLQQTSWKHTAVFPEKLVEELLNRVSLKDKDTILDPFAGTGTVGAVVKKLQDSFMKSLHFILIEKSNEFIDIIKKRIKIQNICQVNDIPYTWKPIKEYKLPTNLKPKEVLTSKYGEVFIANSTREFLSILKGITTERFKKFHREDAIYFFGIKNWDIDALYYVHTVFYEGYVLRNMLIVSNGKSWYPIFMLAKDSTKVEYRFYLDRVRVKPKNREYRIWKEEDFIGLNVRDNSGKKAKEGKIVKVIEKYEDGFPKIVVVQWNEYSSAEFALHPERDEILMEGLIFKCPKCKSVLKEVYDPTGKNICPSCGTTLWTSIETLPIVEEPEEIVQIFAKLEKINHNISGFNSSLEVEFRNKKGKKLNSKFLKLKRINWGASPGARKLILGESFTKMRLYRVDQPIIAQYLNILRQYKGLRIKDIVNKLPKSYKHTVGHWFRKDFGGSIPIPEDIALIKRIFNVEDDNLLNALQRTVLKFQTVKTSVKGKNPGDFIENLATSEVIEYLKKLYIPSQEYINQLQLNQTQLQKYNYKKIKKLNK